jgi:transposase
VLRDLARRALRLSAETAQQENSIRAIIAAWRPDLLAKRCRPHHRRHHLVRLVPPRRVRSEAAFAMLAAAPIPADSGTGSTSKRFRLNRYGDRHLNWALHTIMLSRLRWDPTTQAYAKQRTAEGKTPREIERCLKRYLARDLYRLLEHSHTA